MTQFCAYLRKSRADAEAEARGEGETLARHRTILSGLAAQKKQPISAWYQEIVSGETISARPEMQRLLADVGAGKWAGVYVMEVERLARGDTTDQGLVAQSFKFSGTKIITPAKVYDPNNEFDEEYFEFSLFMSRREFKTINRRLQAGRMQSVREGKYIGSRPAYGYRKVKLADTKGYTLAIHEEEAEVVRQIFDWYINGDAGESMGLVRIAGRLHDLRVSPGEQGTTWKPCRVHRILSNEVYIGKIRRGYVKTEARLTEQGVTKRRAMSREYALYDGLHEPIIDEETFYAARQIAERKENVPVRRDHEISNPLVGILVCANCGHAMRGKPSVGRQPAQVFCATRGCGTVRTYRAPVEKLILDTLHGWLESYETVVEDDQPAPSITSVESMAIDRLAGELATLNKQKNRLHDLLEQGVYTVEVYAERHTLLTQNITGIERQLAELKGKRQPEYCTVEEIAPDIRHVLDTYDETETALAKNALLRTVISKIEYDKSLRGNQHIPADQFRLKVYPKVRG